MLRMIIADDEFIVRDGLKNIVPWHEFGIEVIADAADGQEAYDLCMELNPDILFTDIRMPLMDGLEAAQKLKEQGSNISIIIISGVQDFNYAKTALSVDAAGYILKPVKIAELKDVVNKVVNKINMEKNTSQKLLQLKNELKENIAIMREKFLTNLISGVYISPKDIWEKVDYFSIPFKRDSFFTVAVMQIDDYEKAIEYFKEENKQLLTFSVCNITDEIINNHGCGISFSTSENEFIIIFTHKSQNEEEYTEICQEISHYIKKFLNTSVSIGIGSSVKEMLYLSNSYNEALSAIQYKFYTGNNSTLKIKDFESEAEDFEHHNIYKLQDQLYKFIKLGDNAGCERVLNDIFTLLTLCKNLPVDYVQSVCIEMVSTVARTIYELGENFDSIYQTRVKIFETIFSCETVFELRQYIITLFLKITQYFSQKYTQKNTKVINTVKEMIRNKYMHNISVLDISKEVYLSPNYLSFIFKQETGETIIEYLTKTRMENAKKLLKETDYKILEIAELVGYENPHYFSTAFKKYSGVHPQKYRS